MTANGRGRYWVWVSYVDDTTDVRSCLVKAEALKEGKAWVTRTNQHTGAKVLKVDVQERISNGAFITVMTFRP